MTMINIPEELIENIKDLIKDDAIKRGYGYESVDDFIIQATKGEIEADKDAVGITL